jgi:hypothetical protein
MTNQIVTGHEADVAATTEETNRGRAEWAALTDAEREERIASGHAKFDADCAAIGFAPFWS